MKYEEYEDLNKAKQKILYLMSVKYNGASNVEAHESDNSNADAKMVNIIKWLNNCNNHLFQMLTNIKVDRHGVPIYRTLTTYMNFNQLVYITVETLQNINKSFFELLPNIGFVEPDNMDMYNKSYEKYTNLVEGWKQVTSRNGQFHVVVNFPRNAYEPTNLQREYDLIIQNTEKLKEYDETVKNTYNYRGGETNTRVIEPDNNNQLFVDDDE
jgi:hypothetical protein